MTTHRRASVRWAAVLLLALLAGPRFGLAQGSPSGGASDSLRVLGQLLDRASGNEISAATISFLSATDPTEVVWRGETAASGRFRSDRIPVATYELRVEALGFPTLQHEIEFTGAGEIDLRIELVPEAVELEPLVVTARRQTRLERNGFFDRRRLGMGHTRTREEIEELNPFRFSDVFRTIPGVQVIPVRGGTGSTLRMRGSCRPDLVVDGITLSGVYSIDDVLSVHDVEAVEVHSIGSAPAEHTRSSSCGAVLVWTRDGSGTDGRPITWRRVLIAAGFVTGVLLLTR